MNKPAAGPLPGSVAFITAFALLTGACSGRDTDMAEKLAAANAAAARAEAAANRAEEAASKLAVKAAGSSGSTSRDPEDDGSAELAGNQDPNSGYFD